MIFKLSIIILQCLFIKQSLDYIIDMWKISYFMIGTLYPFILSYQWVKEVYNSITNAVNIDVLIILYILMEAKKENYIERIG